MTKDSKYLIRVASEEELESLRRQHHAHWGGGLDVEQYLGREKLLASQALTREGGITCWVLASTDDQDVVLASCETIQKEALVAYRDPEGGEKPVVKDVISHAIGGVFTPKEHRKNGYASIIMRHVGEKLRTQREDGFVQTSYYSHGNGITSRSRRKCYDDDEMDESPFSVLYSDIGKCFYANLGWLPYSSFHISLPPLDSPSVQVSPSHPKSTTIKSIERNHTVLLCELDCFYIKQDLENSHIPRDATAKIAFRPTWQIMRWHHAREEYVGKHLRGKIPKIKGACTSDEKQWCIWTRTFAPHDKKLTILRFADWRANRRVRGGKILLQSNKIGILADREGNHNGNSFMSFQDGTMILQHGEGEEREVEKNDDYDSDEGLVNLIQAARREAHIWDLPEVVIWNPSERILRAAEKAIGKKVQVVNREEESIPSLRWSGVGVDGCGQIKGKGKGNWSDEKVLWEYNEKFAWC